MCARNVVSSKKVCLILGNLGEDSGGIFMGIELFLWLFLWVFLWLLVLFDISMSMMLFLWAYHSIHGIVTDSPG